MSQFKVGDRVRVRPDAFLIHDSTFFQMSKPYQVKIHTIVRFGDSKTLMFDHTGWAFEPEIFERVPIELMKTKEELTAELAGMEAQLAQLRKDVAAIPCAAPEEERWKPKSGDCYLAITGSGRVERWTWRNDTYNEGHFNSFNCAPVEQEEEVKRKAEIERVSRKARYWRERLGGRTLDGSESEIAFIIGRDKIRGEFKSLPQNIYGLIEFAFKERRNADDFITAMGNDLNILYPPKQ